jgi:hypothetical protein
MSTPPGQEPRPGFTPRADQGRPGGRGDSGRPDGAYRRDDSGPRQPPPGASRGGAGRDAHDTEYDADDYWTSRRQSGGRAAGGRDPAASRDRDGTGQQRRDRGYRDPREQPARRPDDRYRNEGPARDQRERADRGDRGWGEATDRRDRGGYGDATVAAGRGTAAPTFASRDVPATAAAGQAPAGGAAPRARSLPGEEASASGKPGPGPFKTPGLRWVGSWRAGRAALVLFAVALVGLVATIAIGHDPGFLIGAMLVVGSLVAAAGARRRSVHTLIPLPAMCYLVMAVVGGVAKDHAHLNDSKEFATNFLTWIGGGFFGLVAATVLLVLITFVRWLGSKLLVSGQLPADAAASGRKASGRAGRDPWTARPSRGNGVSRADRGPRDRAPSGNAFGESRGARAREDGAVPGDRAPRPNRGPRDARDRNDTDGWGDSGTDDARGQRDGRGQRDDLRRPRPTDGSPRDLW